MNNLVHLDLEKNKLCDVSQLIQSDLPKLRILMLRNNPLKTLGEIKLMPKLEELRIDDTVKRV